ncbi:MAG: hypothetical protein WEB52_12370 [Dehalococcoidia bacterium]
MTLLRSAGAGGLAFAGGLLAFIIAMIVIWVIASLSYDWTESLSRDIRTTLAVGTVVAACLAAVACLLFVSQQASARLNANALGSLFVAAVLAGLIFYQLLEILSETNACMWDVGVPLDRECWSK